MTRFDSWLRHRPMAMMYKALLAAQSPSRLRRCWIVFTDEAGTRLTSHNATKSATERIRSVFPPAARKGLATTT